MFAVFSSQNSPTGAGHNTPAPAATLNAQLLRLLQQDELAFNLEFENLDPATQKHLVRQTGPGSLLPAALAADRAEAVMLMRPPTKRAWALGYNPYSDARLTRLATRTQQPCLTAALHARGLMHATTLEAALRIASAQVLVALVRVNRVPEAVLQNVLPAFAHRLSAETLRAWLSQGQIAPASYVRAMAPDRTPEQGEALLRDIALHAEAPTPVEALRWLGPDFEQACTWLSEGLIAGEDALTALPELSREQVIELFHFGFIDVAQYVASGKATEKDMREFVAQRRITATDCMSFCPVSEALAQQWWRQRLITDDAYARGRGQFWVREDPLPLVHIRRAQRAQDIHVELLLLPAPTDARARHAMRLRLLAEWVAAQGNPPRAGLSAPVLPTWVQGTPGAQQVGLAGQWLFQGFNTLSASLGSIAANLGLGRALPPEPGLLASSAPQATTECFACTEATDDAEPAVTLVGCEHPAMLHAACLRDHAQARIDQGYMPNCPVEGCKLPITGHQAVMLGLDADRLDALATLTVLTYHTPHWKPCPTEGCIAGVDLLPGRGLMRECAMCEKQVTFTDLDEDLLRIREVALMMVEGMGALEGTNTQIRPCYHCGHATMRTQGCFHMVCGRNTDNRHIRVRQQGCGQSWDFVGGGRDRGGASAFSDSRQTYVPRSGEMVRAGLFEPLPPGFVHTGAQPLPGGHADLQALARANARRLGWLPAT